MNAAQFRFALEQLFGEGWRKKAREWLDVSESTLDRWASGQIEPIGPAIAAVQAQLHLKRRLDFDKAANRRRKFGKVSPKQLEVLQLVAAGYRASFEPPTPRETIAGREATIRSCVKRTWLDEERKSTDLGRKVAGLEDE
mgnify:FL=1